jgi:hypothetical protein
LPWSILDARRDDHSRHASSAIIPLSITVPNRVAVYASTSTEVFL